MIYDPARYHRRSIRLRGYDYSQPGTYYVTICTHGKKRVLGEVVEGEMVLNERGRMVDRVWKHMPQRFPIMGVDEHVVMPNHFHAIFQIVGAPLMGVQAGAGTRPAPTVGDIVGAFKSLTTCECIQSIQPLGWPPFDGKFWQRNFYERIIRNEDELNKIREYIRTNPLRWDTDPENL